MNLTDPNTQQAPGQSIIDKFRNKSTNRFIPLQASLELTYRCNERCGHCYIDKFWDDPAKVLQKEDWDLILQKLRNAGTLYLILMGGEAMLNPFFWDILKHGKDLGFHVSMITNGLKIQTPEVAFRLKEFGLQVATISLYSMDPSVHDSITKVSGSHQKTMKAIKLLSSQGIEIGINCLLTKLNIDGFFEVAEWCIENNIIFKEDVNVTPKFNGDLSTTLLRASSEQITHYYREKIKRWPNGKPNPVIESGEDYACNIAKGKCAINPYGELLGCIEIRKPLGSLKDQEFDDIWNNREAEKWRSIKVKDIKGLGPKKDGCGHFCEHCLGMALHESGDALQVTPDGARLAQIREAIYLENTPNVNIENSILR